jgi:MFS family permease
MSLQASTDSQQVTLPPVEPSDKPWWRLLTRYHWFVFLVASAAWFFDCLDQRLFSLARIPALVALMGKPATDVSVQSFGKVVTAFFLIGWGIGGLVFGSLGDKFGRARMLTLTILIYSAFTGLTFISHTRADFVIFRFMTGLGVGGVFGLAVALIAETVPSGARIQTLGLLQVLSTIGNLTAGVVKMGVDALEASKIFDASNGHWWWQGWRWMFLVGAVPAAMVILTGRYLREPEPWLRLKERGQLPKGGLLAPYRGLVRDRRWRRNLVVGALIASTGVVGLWAIGEYAPDIQRAVFRTHYEAQTSVPVVDIVGGTPQQVAEAKAAAAKARDLEVKHKVDHAISIAYILNMLGAGVGMWLFTKMAAATGRRTAFFVGFAAALVITFGVYWKMNSPIDAYWMMPLMGAAQLSVFAGFSIYLPELFPSRMRSTGTSFCYNLGRFAAAGGSFFSSVLTVDIFGRYPSPLPFRYSAMTMCVIFFVGLLTLPFAPETRGKPLPEDAPPPDEMTPKRGFEPALAIAPTPAD